MSPYKDSSEFCDSEGLLESEADEHDFSPKVSTPWNWKNILFLALNTFFLCVSGLLCLISYHNLHLFRQNYNNSLLKTVDFYSPLHDIIDVSFVDTHINGSLLSMHESIYRAPPSPEVDAAWHRIGSLMPHIINSEQVIKLGKDPTKTARAPAEWGFGDDAHLAELDVLHTIHCLDAIRKDVHWIHYFKDRYPNGEFPELHRTHTDHCIYVVLQNLMCSATLDIVTTPWVEGQLHPFPDFTINKKCRNFDAILEWHEDTMLNGKIMEKYLELRRPAGVTPYRMSEEFRRMFGVGDVSEALHGGHVHA